MSAARLARGFTGRDLLLKFEGCYHGHGDSFLSQAGSGLATLGISASPGVPEAMAALTLSVALQRRGGRRESLRVASGQDCSDFR